MRLALVFLVGCGADFKKEAQCSKAITTICDHQLECGLIADHATCAQELEDDTRCNLDKDLEEFEPCLDSIDASSCVVGIPSECLNVLCPAEGPCDGTVDTDFCDVIQLPDDAPTEPAVSETGTSVMCYVPPDRNGGTCQILKGSEMNALAYSGGNDAVDCPEEGILVTDGTCPTDRVLGTCKNTQTKDEIVYYKCNIGDGPEGNGNGAQGHCDARNPEVTGTTEERPWVWTLEGATPATQ